MNNKRDQKSYILLVNKKKPKQKIPHSGHGSII